MKDDVVLIRDALKRRRAGADVDYAFNSAESALKQIESLRRHVHAGLEIRRHIPDPKRTCERAQALMEQSGPWVTKAYTLLAGLRVRYLTMCAEVEDEYARERELQAQQQGQQQQEQAASA